MWYNRMVVLWTEGKKETDEVTGYEEEINNL